MSSNLVTSEEICQKRAELVTEASRLQYDLDVVHGQLVALMRLCTHPNRYPIVTMGESGERCPDCGWGR